MTQLWVEVILNNDSITISPPTVSHITKDKLPGPEPNDSATPRCGEENEGTQTMIHYVSLAELLCGLCWPQTYRILLPLPSSAGIKGLHHYAPHLIYS